MVYTVTVSIKCGLFASKIIELCVWGVASYKEFNKKLPLHMRYAAKIDKPNCDKVKPPFIIKNVNVFEV